MDLKKFVADLAAGYRKLTGYEAGRKAGHDAGRTGGYEAGRKAGHHPGRGGGDGAGHDPRRVCPRPARRARAPRHLLQVMASPRPMAPVLIAAATMREAP